MSMTKLMFATLLGLGCLAQDPVPPQADPAPPQEPHFIVLEYPTDREVAVAVVGGQPVTLGALIDHLDARHHPGFKAALEQEPLRPDIHRYLQSDLMAPWVRHFADLKAFEFVTKEAGVDQQELDAAISKRLKTEFEAWLQKYVANLEANGHPTDLPEQQINKLLSRYQLENGLANEVQGWLDYFEPGIYNRQQLRDFYNENARAFGGMVTIAHILIQHRDAGTGLLLKPEGYGLASERLADVKARLRPDGRNFEEVARNHSQDRRTAQNGGVLTGIHRFDDRLPASLCRAAWQLQDGEVSDVVESPYGWHLIKRLECTQKMHMLFTDDAIPSVEIVMRRAMQESHLFDARQRAGVELKL